MGYTVTADVGADNSRRVDDHCWKCSHCARDVDESELASTEKITLPVRKIITVEFHAYNIVGVADAEASLTHWSGAGKIDRRKTASAQDVDVNAASVSIVTHDVATGVDPANEGRSSARNINGVFSAVDVPGAASTFIGWINARGDIVGNYTDARGVHVYVLSRGSFTTIDFPGTAPMCKAGFGISDADDVVGVEFDCNDFSHGQGYLFSGGQFTFIDVPGAVGTFPTMIIDSTRIVGAYVGSDGVTHGFLRQTGNFTTLDVPNSTLTWVTGINPEGDIVGFYNSQDGKQHGFVLSDGEFISIDIPGATSSEANGINPQGDVVGRYVTPDGNTHGYFLRCAACCRHDECSIKQ